MMRDIVGAFPPPVKMTAPQVFVKRVFDLFSVLVILILFGWLMVIVAVAIRFTGKTVTYAHMRVGKDGRDFPCYKFRSMYEDSDRMLAELLARDPAAAAEWERDFKLKNDPRIMGIGHFIRKFSLDELPQLWNVVRGDMSIVGPRPVVRAELDKYYGDARLHYTSMRPGLTGLWQVSGRSDLSYADRVRLDVSYSLQWSPVADFFIVMRTVRVMFGASGAY